VRRYLFLLGVCWGLFWAGVSWAHFLVLLPERDLVGAERRAVNLEIFFTHPMEGGPVMPLERPQKVGVFVRGKEYDLTPLLKVYQRPVYEPWRHETSDKKVPAWRLFYECTRPGDHVFYVVPEPYFEPAEGVFIQQITKVIVNAFGAETGWDAYLGFPIEIVPLVRPYGLWEGNLFCGRVLKDGKPLPGAEIEVEFLNDGSVRGVSGPFVTQVLKTDQEGEFCYTIPWAGWWGFAVLSEGKTLSKDGQEYPLELDAVIWLRAYPRPVRK